ncbi:MAG: hypothetical protein ACI4B3_00020 [Prevotella sp.]
MQEHKQSYKSCIYIKAIVIFCIAFVVGCNVVYASNGQQLTKLTVADGLSGETVCKTMIDHSGRVWIATTNGISVYNGMQLSAFHIRDDGDWLVAVHDLCQARDKSVYAATETGLYHIKYGGKEFKRILPEIESPECLLACGDSIYIGGRQGFMLYDGKRLTTRMVGVAKNSLDNIVRHYVRTDDGQVWYLSRFNLHCLNPTDATCSSQPRTRATTFRWR